MQHPGIQGPFGGHRPSSKSSSRSGSRGSSRADSFAAEQGGSTRILSRDVIISMCHGGERLSSESSEHSNPDLGALGSMDSTAAPVAMTTVEGEMKRALPGGGRGSSSAREDSTFKGLPAKEDNQKQGPPGVLSGLEHDSSPPRVNSEVNLNLGAEQSANGAPAGSSLCRFARLPACLQQPRRYRAAGGWCWSRRGGSADVRRRRERIRRCAGR